MKYQAVIFSILSFLSLSGLLFINAQHSQIGNFCTEVTKDDYNATAMAKTINAPYAILDKKRPSTTQSWEALNIQGLDSVNLNIVHSYESPIEDVFTLKPITQNHNSVNIENKAILVRLGFNPPTNDAKKNNRGYRYFAITELYGCNLHIPKGTSIKLQSFQWAYAVLLWDTPLES